MSHEQDSVVLDWIKRTGPPFNEALKKVAEKRNVNRAVDHQVGWELLRDGTSIFTGRYYCDSASEAYGLAIYQKFPQAHQIKRIWFEHQRGALHAVAGFSLSGDYLVDGTYGQINGQENEVLVAPISDLTMSYSNRVMTWVTIENFRLNFPGIEHKVVDDKIIIAPFNPRLYLEKLKRYQQEKRTFGCWRHHHEESVFYLAKKLLKVE